jgi:putative transposase
MTRLEDRQTLAAEIAETCAAGARLAPACALAGIDVRTFQRWRAGDDLVQADRRPEAVRARPAHALSEAERARIVALANEPRFADVPPARIVPALADEGVYLASEASFHRVLREHGQMRRRGRARPPRTVGPPSTHVATGPGQVWCWDVTFLPARVRGRWFYLFLILDLYSRKVVGFEVHDTDQAEHAAHLVRRTALAEGIHARAVRPALHGYNGPSVKGTTVLTIRTQSIGRSWRAAAAWWRVQGDGMTDLQAAVADDDALDQQLQDRLPFGKVCLIEPGADAAAERRQVGADCLRLQPLLA